MQAARMYELCADKKGTVAGGLLVLLVCLSPQAHRWVRVANVSVLIGWLIGFATLALVRRRDAAGAVALCVGGIAKYALLVLAPLYLAMRRWRAILICVVLTVVILAVSVAVMGSLEPYRTFVREIAPTLGRTAAIAEDQALYPTILRITGRDSMPAEIGWAFDLAKWVSLAVILWGVFTTPRRYWLSASGVIGAALALVAWMLVFSPICWEHYFAYLAPFWGWLAYQATRSRARLVGGALAIAMAWLPTALIRSFRLPEPLFSHLCWSMCLMMCMAMWVMYREKNPQQSDGMGG